MAEIISFNTSQKEVLVDITPELRQIIRHSRVQDGLVNLFTRGSSTAILIQADHNSEASLDVLDLLSILIPEGVWLHDGGEGTADAHLKSGLIGPSKTIPLMDGSLLLSDDQKVLFCEFDGPQHVRQVICTVVSDR